MKKLLLTIVAALTIFCAQAQCQADFSYMQNGPTTIFTDLSTINSGWSTNYSVTWEWDFGDGTPVSTQQNPVHTYANNGIYTPCLTVLYFDSVIINTCVSVYCDSILVGNSIPASWDCNPTTGCYDPGTGLGQYTSLSACQAVCGTPTPSWDCNSTGCYDPGTGMGQYTTLAACQAICVSTVSNACDSMTLVSVGAAGSPQTILMAQVPISFMDIHYWITTAPDGTVLNEDSLWNTHQIDNMNNVQCYDTLNICITYADAGGYLTCCVTWIWDSNLGVWAKMGSVTSIGEIDLFDKKLIKVVDILGRETSINSNQTLFFIYEDGTIEKRYIIDRNY